MESKQLYMVTLTVLFMVGQNVTNYVLPFKNDSIDIGNTRSNDTPEDSLYNPQCALIVSTSFDQSTY